MSSQDNVADTRLLTGRHLITSPYDYVDETNVVEVLQDTLFEFSANSEDINYLWNYYKGRQPILNREKDVRPEINNKVVENHAQEIVAFKVGYQLAEPLQYTNRKSDEGEADSNIDAINALNTLMFAEDKASCDRDLFEWMCIAGVGYRMCEADTEQDREEGGAPFELYTLDPRNTYVVYSSAYHKHQLMSVWVGIEPQTERMIYNVFTDTHFYKVIDNVVVEAVGHTYKHNPIVEYDLNASRMGVFEPVLPLLDAINKIDSNRIDGIEQTVQALMKFVNVDIDEEGLESMRRLGAIKLTSREGIVGDVDVVNSDLDQSQTQVAKEDLYNAIVNICGMPNRSGGGTSSDTGAAVLLRDGWTLAEAHAKNYELQFKRAERNMLRVALEICRQSGDCDIDLRIRDIELTFNRRNYENILTKAQVLTTMLSTNDIHPELGFQACGLFTDPEAAYSQSKEYKEAQEQKALEMTAQTLVDTDTDEGQDGEEPEANESASKATTPEPKQ